MTPLGPEWEAIENVKDPAIKAALLLLLRMMPAPVSVVETPDDESSVPTRAEFWEKKCEEFTRENLALTNERDEARRELEVERARRERVGRECTDAVNETVKLRAELAERTKERDEAKAEWAAMRNYNKLRVEQLGEVNEQLRADLAERTKERDAHLAQRALDNEAYSKSLATAQARAEKTERELADVKELGRLVVNARDRRGQLGPAATNAQVNEADSTLAYRIDRLRTVVDLVPPFVPNEPPVRTTPRQAPPVDEPPPSGRGWCNDCTNPTACRAAEDCTDLPEHRQQPVDEPQAKAASYGKREAADLMNRSICVDTAREWKGLNEDQYAELLDRAHEAGKREAYEEAAKEAEKERDEWDRSSTAQNAHWHAIDNAIRRIRALATDAAAKAGGGA